MEVISIEIRNRLQIVFTAIDCVSSLGTEHREGEAPGLSLEGDYVLLLGKEASGALKSKRSESFRRREH